MEADQILLQILMAKQAKKNPPKYGSVREPSLMTNIEPMHILIEWNNSRITWCS